MKLTPQKIEQATILARIDNTETQVRAKQVGWLGPYGIVPGGMDVDPAKNWKPIFVLKEVPDRWKGVF